MYRVQVSTEFVADHVLTVVDFGPESERHSHAYSLTLRVAGHQLDVNGYLVNIDLLLARLDEFAERYRDTMLNDQPAFSGLNPSVEHFARIGCEFFRERLPTENLDSITVIIGEDEIAEASYTLECG